MSQQHAQFEEEFHDGPRPRPSYQESYVKKPSVSYPPAIPAPTPTYTYMPGQKLQVPAQNSGQASIAGRIVLAIFSMIFIFGMFMAALAMSIHRSPVSDVASALSIVFAFAFAIIVVILNLIVNRRH